MSERRLVEKSAGTSRVIKNAANFGRTAHSKGETLHSFVKNAFVPFLVLFGNIGYLRFTLRYVKIVRCAFHSIIIPPGYAPE